MIIIGIELYGIDVIDIKSNEIIFEMCSSSPPVIPPIDSDMSFVKETDENRIKIIGTLKKVEVYTYLNRCTQKNKIRRSDQNITLYMANVVKI